MMGKVLPVCALGVVLMGLGAGRVDAEPVRVAVTFTAQGTFGATEELLGLSLVAGSVFAGTFTYDPLAPVSRVRGVYPNSGSLQMNTGSRIKVPLEIAVANNAPQCETGCDILDIFHTEGRLPHAGFYEDGVVFGMAFAAPSWAITSNALPPTAAEFLAAFQTGRFGFKAQQVGWNAENPSHEVYGTMQASDVTVTPEPGSLLLLGTGLLGVFRTVRRRYPAIHLGDCRD